ncbi:MULTISPECIES: AI-2E family transporter [unclassified Salipiger]|uniref:AI-2E family transporter n=1 Tax=unclassified Salipiger TaxID=2640570 RepID=UPI00080A9CCB|nr:MULTISPECIES: AI-2E family transporter [unclassified Salipiger]ANT59844.1 AI-2E family transporter [Salipiger sp. CCB-MM3]NDV99685.1 AI-2E family transporter [Salipiger sp. PrR002]NDW56717.1 AI-2E family transporter [Salipiger sp. PrR004]
MNRAPSHDPVLRVSAAILAGLALLVGLKLAEDIFAPLLLAITVGVIFAPVVDRLAKFGLPRGLVAIALIVLIFFVVIALGFLVEPYVTSAIDRIPTVKYEIRKFLFEYRDLIRGIDEVEQALGAAKEKSDEAGGMPTVSDALYLAPVIVAQSLVFFGGLFFFLLTRWNIYNWMSRRIGDTTTTAVMLDRFCSAENAVSRYFATITAINIGLGFAVTGGLMAIGMSGAPIWGIAAALLNFVLYVGPAAMAAGLLLNGLVAFDGLMSFAPMAIYLALNMCEAQFVTPGLVGKHIQINPFMIFVSLVFWLWLWGPLGGIVAIPTTVIVLNLFNILGEGRRTQSARRTPD